jgi:putative phosphoribosyl transferase
VVFLDRLDAGQRLGERLSSLRGPDIVVLGLPRGGVPVAFEVARVLGAPLDVLVVRKLGVPFQPELAMGAIGEDGALVLNHGVMQQIQISRSKFVAIEQRERAELESQATRYRNGYPRISLVGRTAVVVDDGIATGSTARAACRVARAQHAARVVLAVPVAPPSSATN